MNLYSIFRRLAWLPLLTLAAGPLPAEEETPAPAPAIRELPDGNVAVRDIIVDRKARAARFPARINMDDGFVEYYLVTAAGKTHESVLVTDVQPNDLHIAMLLLGVDPPKTADPSRKPPANIGDEWLASAPEPTGPPVTITVSFQNPKGESVRLDSGKLLVLGEKERKPAPDPGWIYSGSLLIEGRFLAQDEGSVIALIRDSTALMNNRLPEAIRDDAWLVNTKTTPKKGTPVTVEIALPPSAPPKS